MYIRGWSDQKEKYASIQIFEYLSAIFAEFVKSTTHMDYGTSATVVASSSYSTLMENYGAKCGDNDSAISCEVKVSQQRHGVGQVDEESRHWRCPGKGTSAQLRPRRCHGQGGVPPRSHDRRDRARWPVPNNVAFGIGSVGGRARVADVCQQVAHVQGEF